MVGNSSGSKNGLALKLGAKNSKRIIQSNNESTDKGYAGQQSGSKRNNDQRQSSLSGIESKKLIQLLSNDEKLSYQEELENLDLKLENSVLKNKRSHNQLERNGA